MASFEIVSPKHGVFIVLVDDEDLERVSAVGPWFINKYGTVNKSYRVMRHVGKTTQYLHHFLTGFKRVDHINRNALDNRRENLRPATQAQNAQNKGVHGNNISGYRGVSWNAERGMWLARVWVDRELKFSQRFKDKEEAARACAEARQKYMPFSAEALN